MPRKSQRSRFKRPKRRYVRALSHNKGKGDSTLPDAEPETTTDHSSFRLAESPSAPVNVNEETSCRLILDSSSSSALPFIEVPCPSSASLSAALRKLSCQLPANWLPTADSKGFHLLFLNSGDVKTIQRQIFVSFLGNASVYVQCYPCPLFDEVFSLLHSPKVFSLDSLDEFCESVLSLVEIVMQYTNCIGVDHEEVKKFNGHPEIFVDSFPFLEADCKDICRSSSCARLVPRESDDVRCEACLNLLEWVKDRIT